MASVGAPDTTTFSLTHLVCMCRSLQAAPVEEAEAYLIPGDSSGAVGEEFAALLQQVRHLSIYVNYSVLSGFCAECILIERNSTNPKKAHCQVTM